MKKILALLGAVGLAATSAATVVACGETENSTTGNLAEANTGLGKLNKNWTNDGIPSKATILNAFNEKNKGKLTGTVKMEEVTFGEVEKDGTPAEGKDQNWKIEITANEAPKDKTATFTGKATLTFTIAKHLELADSTNALGEIKLDKGQPTANVDQIIPAFMAKNNVEVAKDTDVTVSAIVVKEDNTGTAKITAVDTSEIVRGSVEVTFTQLPWVGKDLDTTKIVKFADDFKFEVGVDEAAVKAKFNELNAENKDIQLGELVLTVDLTVKTLTVTVKEDSTVYNQLDSGFVINFEVKVATPELVDLDTTKIVKFADDFKFEVGVDEAAVKAKFNELNAENKDIQLGELVLTVDLTVKTLTVTVKEDSTVYNQLDSGFVINFTVATAE